MKTALLLLILTVVLNPFTYAQTINNVPLKEVDAEYILISSESRIGNKISIDLDFGQEDESFNTKDHKLLNEDKRPMEFNSIIGAFNFLSKYGYELVETYVVPTETSGYTYHILRKKKV